MPKVAVPVEIEDWNNPRNEQKDMQQALNDAFRYSQRYYQLSVQLIEALEHLTKDDRPKWVTQFLQESRSKLRPT